MRPTVRAVVSSRLSALPVNLWCFARALTDWLPFDDTGKAKGKAAAKAKAKPAATAGRKGKKGAPANEDDEEEEDVEEEESGSDADLEDLDSEESEEASEEDEEDDGGRRGKRGGKPQPAKPKVEAKPDSIASLKRKLAEAKEKAAAKRAREEPAGDGEGGEEGQAPAGVPIEAERILTQEVGTGGRGGGGGLGEGWRLEGSLEGGWRGAGA